MPVTVLMSIEGVLVKDDESWATGQPLYEGRVFYAALARDTRLLLYSERNEGENGVTWLKMNGFREHALLLVPKSPSEDRPSTVMELYDYAAGQLSEHIDVVLDPHPEVIAEVLKRGTVGLLWVHPQYALPGARPDDGRGVRPWEEITTEVDRQREKRKQVEADLEPEISMEGAFEAEGG